MNSLVADEDSGDDEVEKDDDEEHEEELEDLDDEGDDEEEDENEEVKEGLKNPPPVLVEIAKEDDDDDILRKGEEEKDDKKERKVYKKPGKTESQWIEHFMHNNNYGIKDNPGHGDCFFYTIRDAYKSIGMDASVSKTRDILTEKVDDAVFNNYKERFDLFNNELTTLKRQLPNDKKRKAKLAKEYNKLAREVKKEKDVPTRKQKTKKAKEMKQKHKSLGEEVKLKERELRPQRQFADIVSLNITNKEQLIAKMKTRDFGQMYGLSPHLK